MIKKIFLDKGLRKNRLINFIFMKLAFLMPKIFNINGYKMILDLRDAGDMSIFKGQYEQFTTKIIENLLKSNDVVIDIGAFVGYFTLLMAKLVKNGMVYSFEPTPETYKKLEKNIKINKFKNILLFNKAVFDKLGTATLNFMKDNNSGNTLFSSKESMSEIVVETFNLDSLNLENVNFIKIDAEGAEFKILKGATRLIENSLNLKMIIEFFPLTLKRAGENPINLLNFIKEKGFIIKNINEETRELEDVKNFNDFLARFPADKNVYTNILIAKNEIK